MKLVAALLLLLGLCAPARADGLGVVLMHGKQGTGTPDDRVIGVLAQNIKAAGFLLEEPSMCWARGIIYAAAFVDCLNAVDDAVGRLKSRGAARIIVAGMSLGGAGALGYGARHEGLAGIVTIAPGPPPGIANRPEIARGIEQAKALVARGRGDEFQTFTDDNEGAISVRATASIFLSFLAFDGAANIVTNAQNLKAPVLWISGTADSTQLPRAAGFDKVPLNNLNRYVTVNSNHLGTPTASSDAVITWLNDVAKN
jgi:pimeloyl-ACP methyl ester carboxylesterase